MTNEFDQFMSAWEIEAQGNTKLLRALPTDKYDFRPDPGGRSLGELAWHLAEVDAWTSFGLEQGAFSFNAKPPGIERPRTVAELAPGYERVHRESVARLKKLPPPDFARELPFFDGRTLPIGQILWGAMLMHSIHHGGQLSLMCRLAGGSAPGLYGPNREEMAKMKEAMQARG